MKLVCIREITGVITVETGLHIGCGDEQMQIGGTDQSVVKHPHSGEPFIPGSSLKGKIRALLELRTGLMDKTGGEPLSIAAWRKADGEAKEQCKRVLILFGTSASEEADAKEFGPTRVSFSDCSLTAAARETAKLRKTSYTEVKAENNINRLNSRATPRWIERVASGLSFDFSLTLKEFENDDPKLLDTLLEGMRLLSLDALGGSGSRGYGRVSFTFSNEADAQAYSALKVF